MRTYHFDTFGLKETRQVQMYTSICSLKLTQKNSTQKINYIKIIFGLRFAHKTVPTKYCITFLQIDCMGKYFYFKMLLPVYCLNIECQRN